MTVSLSALVLAGVAVAGLGVAAGWVMRGLVSGRRRRGEPAAVAEPNAVDGTAVGDDHGLAPSEKR